ncbi:MAG: response regulator [Candidatus Omnitrophica bacterium]|nr:response regulator [Candidatus Omnitrophota bacterium]
MPKLLIVDDEVDVREFAGNFFRKRGVDVVLSSGGAEALTLIADHRPDLVLLDIRMAEISGMDVLRQIRAAQDGVRVVMVSGLEDDSIVAEAKNLGAVTFIHKPLVLEELENVVLRELGLKS